MLRVIERFHVFSAGEGETFPSWDDETPEFALPIAAMRRHLEIYKVCGAPWVEVYDKFHHLAWRYENVKIDGRGLMQWEGPRSLEYEIALKQRRGECETKNC